MFIKFLKATKTYICTITDTIQVVAAEYERAVSDTTNIYSKCSLGSQNILKWQHVYLSVELWYSMDKLLFSKQTEKIYAS